VLTDILAKGYFLLSCHPVLPLEFCSPLLWLLERRFPQDLIALMWLSSVATASREQVIRGFAADLSIVIL